MKMLTSRCKVRIVNYSLDFLNDGCGYYFNCDSLGNLLNPANEPKYRECLAHPDDYDTFNELTTSTYTYTEPATGRCECGEVIEVVDDYMGACECPHCGLWHSLDGQLLSPPDGWEEHFDDDY